MEFSKEIADLADSIQKECHRHIDSLLDAKPTFKRQDAFAVFLYLKIARLEKRVRDLEKQLSESKLEDDQDDKLKTELENDPEISDIINKISDV